MRLGIMQPYFFPYVGYYSLLKHSDHFILFDTVQFIRHGWIERNRILKPQEGWQYIGVPLEKYKQATLIKDLRIKNTENWRDKILRQVEHYKKRAPFYKAVINLLQESLAVETDSIVKLNENILRSTCNYLAITLKLDLLSEMDLEVEKADMPGDWALNICKAMGAKEYINPIGGIEIFDVGKYNAQGVSIKFLKNLIQPYSQRREVFEPGLSILDLLMFNDVEAVNQLIDKYEFV